ncbi:hypothetical protein QUF56_13885 [Ureibacillus composti]|nr:hypothetical protein [Ureibacillus composti]
MWVITVFDQNTVRMFEFENKNEAKLALVGFNGSAILSYTK